MTQPTTSIGEGVAIPDLGLGTYRVPGDGAAYDAVRAAVELGYRHVDTAAAYGNEEDVGRAVRDSRPGPDGVFVTSKVPREDVAADRVRPAVEGSLERLGLDRIDLMLLHWPTGDGRLGAWETLLELGEQGPVRAAGVSNFLVPHLEELADAGLPLPAVNQIELHPFLFGSRRPTVEWCEAAGVAVQAYSPLALTRRFDHPTVSELAGRAGLTPAQLHIRWGLEHDWVVIPKTTHPDRMRENLDALDAELEASTVARLDDLDEHLVVSWNPEEQL